MTVGQGAIILHTSRNIDPLLTHGAASRAKHSSSEEKLDLAGEAGNTRSRPASTKPCHVTEVGGSFQSGRNNTAGSGAPLLPLWFHSPGADAIPPTGVPTQRLGDSQTEKLPVLSSGHRT